MPDLTPLIVSGQMTLLKVVQEFAPRSRDASINAGFNLSSALINRQNHERNENIYSDEYEAEIREQDLLLTDAYSLQ